ncbi:MAG: spermidine synthase [Bdellovibrio bacteriovorus]
MTLIVWGLSGGVFGALFAGLYGILSTLGFGGWQPPLVATAAAAVTTTALYSAMPVALVGAMAGVLASIGALILMGQNLALSSMAAAGGVAGVVAGTFYAWMAQSGGRPLAEAITGLLAGLVAGLVLASVVTLVGHQMETLTLAAGAVALVGTLFQVSDRWIVDHIAALLPGGLSAALVAGLIAILVASSIWVLGGTGAYALAGTAGDALGQVRHEIGPGFIGGLLGGAVTGLILELLGFRLEEHA